MKNLHATIHQLLVSIEWRGRGIVCDNSYHISYEYERDAPDVHHPCVFGEERNEDENLEARICDCTSCNRRDLTTGRKHYFLQDTGNTSYEERDPACPNCLANIHPHFMQED
jgi:hypothetical protein